ncbi:MAG: DUF1232 domain-containing protein [Burkholderiales bacterium]|nr:MAG: DUF1232 domain-containing protein [Burkholderiales bacterium]
MPALPLLLLRFKRLITKAGRESLILYYACRHPATPRSIKLVAILMAIYLVSPVDAVSDLLPLLGWVDDAMVLTIGLPWLLRRLPPRVLQEASEQADAWIARRARGP